MRSLRAPCFAVTLLSTMVTMTASSSAHALEGTTRTFPFQDETLLRDGQTNGGLVWIHDRARHTDAPLVVFLHGANGSTLHRWLGGAGDVRPIVAGWAEAAKDAADVPIVAGPSQTRDARSGTTLWPSFDLDAFVDAVEAELPDGVTIDETRILVVGHSGAGCNEDGGLVSAARGTIAPMALVAIDTCMDGRFGDLLDDAVGEAPAWVFWEPSWPRAISDFRARFEDERPQLRRTVRIDTPKDVFAHGAIVERALPMALDALLRMR